MLLACRFVDIEYVEQVLFETVCGLLRIVHDIACIFCRFCIIFIHIECHVLILRHAMVLCGSDVQISLGKKSLRCCKVCTAGLRHCIIVQEVARCLEIGNDYVPHRIKAFRKSYLRVLESLYRSQMDRHPSEVPCQVEIGICPHEICLAHISVLVGLVNVHVRDILDDRIRPVDGDV